MTYTIDPSGVVSKLATPAEDAWLRRAHLTTAERDEWIATAHRIVGRRRSDG